MVEISINNKVYKVSEQYTILQACEEIGLQIPRFCYHERLSIAGNCRMCLVEVKNSVKPVASCAMNVSQGMEIWTNTLLVKKAREGVMEFLLANHPLDCPICDQGGECDLQDQAMLFGNDRGRFYESKRSVSNKDCGPFIKTVMTRCIHCTRCVRFSTELGGLQELGTTGRGNSTEIGNYVSKALKSEVSGNLIDLCPVGALTSKPYAFKARSWELKATETIDTLDSMGSNIVLHSSGKRVLRVLPTLHEGVNESWIDDRTRFNYDGFLVQRLTKPFILRSGTFIEAEWYEIFIHYFLTNQLASGLKQLLVVGQGLSSESTLRMKEHLEQHNIFVKNEVVLNIPADFRNFYSFNSGYMGLEEADLCILVGTNLKGEMPLLLMRLRKAQRQRNLTIISFGSTLLEGLDSFQGGNSQKAILRYLEGRHALCSLHKTSKKPLIIVGEAFLSSGSSTSLLGLSSLAKKDNWDGFNALLPGSSSYNIFDLGLLSEKVLTNDESTISSYNTHNIEHIAEECQSYFGSHGSTAVNKFKALFPLLLSSEKDSIFLNNEGRPQLSKFAVDGPGQARSDLELFKSLSLFTLPQAKELKSEQTLLEGLVMNLPKHESFVNFKMHKIPANVSSNLLSNEATSVFGNDYISINSRNVLSASASLLETQFTNFRV